MCFRELGSKSICDEIPQSFVLWLENGGLNHPNEGARQIVRGPNLPSGIPGAVFCQTLAKPPLASLHLHLTTQHNLQPSKHNSPDKFLTEPFCWKIKKTDLLSSGEVLAQQHETEQAWSSDCIDISERDAS